MDFFLSLDLKQLPIYLYYYCKNTKKTLIDLKLGLYWVFVILRIILTLFPQTGYIHPDEYFQTVEVFAGSTFGVEVSLPWEFNASFPIRSVLLTYTSMQIPFAVLRYLSELLQTPLNINLTSHYLLLVVPRLSMCLISFISDICLFKICYQFCQNYKERLIIFSSSFVCLIFMTRTFTNTIEITCFNVLLFLVASCMAESEKVNYQNSFLKDKYNEATTIPDKIRIYKLMKVLPKHSLKKCIPISIVTVAGIFNRPTFALYATTPLFYWFQRGLDVKSTYLKDFHIRILIFTIYCIPSICFFIYFDSVYYGYITWGEILNLKISTNNFVVTPLNFIKYNINPTNLSKHGLHPRFLHFLINIPLLFNVLGLSGLIVITKLFYRSSVSNWTLLPKSQSITGLMTLSFIVPVFGLSMFAHQEPRFITPILLPLVFLYAHLVRDFEEHCTLIVPFRKLHPKRKEITGIFAYPLKCITYFEKATENFDNRFSINGRYLMNLKKREVVETTTNPKPATQLMNEFGSERKEEINKENDNKKDHTKKRNKKDFTVLWYVLNGFCVFFFGFLHQGGIYGLSKDFHYKLLEKPKYTTYHLITSHVYSLPLHLVFVKRNYKYKNTNFIVHEMGSDNFENINLKLITTLKLAEEKKNSVRRNYRVFYALPTSYVNQFIYSHYYYSTNYSYQIRNIYYPHLSTEALPTLKLNISDESEFRLSKISGLLKHFDCMPLRYLSEFFHQFGLILLEITFP